MTSEQAEAFWQRLRTAIEARAGFEATRALNALTAEQQRQIVEVAVDLTGRLQEGRLP